jgi:hypothetical protein
MTSATNEALSLSDKLLVAAVDLSGGATRQDFTAEDLVVHAWKADNLAFGLRGHESVHPDSNKVYTKLDGKSGIVTKGWLAKAGERRLRVTEAGLARAVDLTGAQDTELLAKLDRTLQDTVSKLLSHPEFVAWRSDSSKPARFRGAGYFWGVAPGMPAHVVRSRVRGIGQTLAAALKILDQRGITDVVRQRGHVLFERRDLELCLDFHRALIERFRGDLRVLDPEGDY